MYVFETEMRWIRRQIVELNQKCSTKKLKKKIIYVSKVQKQKKNNFNNSLDFGKHIDTCI